MDKNIKALLKQKPPYTVILDSIPMTCYGYQDIEKLRVDDEGFFMPHPLKNASPVWISPGPTGAIILEVYKRMTIKFYGNILVRHVGHWIEPLESELLKIYANRYKK